MSAVFGQNLPPVNLGIGDNAGYEIELNYNGHIGKDFSYRVKALTSVAKNKIKFADEPTYANAIPGLYRPQHRHAACVPLDQLL